MLNCHWEEVHYFIQRGRDDTEGRHPFDKILTKNMDFDVEEFQSKDFKHVLPDVSRKPKMKVKAAKVFKYLLNFLQMKPKKFEDKEKLCIPSTPQDSFAYENPESYEFDRLQTPNSSCHKPDGILSMSWSYLVHDPFKEASNLEEEADLENEMFYTDSYFEDDYCQDFREKDWAPFRTPSRDVQNVSCRNRLFEPEKTPCGEYKRSVVTRGTPCRRHASLPNFLVDSPNVSVSLADATQTDPFDDSEELVDVEDFMVNHPPVGLNIAFDNVLEETNSESLLYSLNPVPFMSPEEIDHFENSNEQSLNETYTCKLETQPSDCYISETSSSDNTPQNSCIARDSIHKLQVLSPSAESILDFDEMLVSEMHPGLERCTLDMLFPSSSCVNRLMTRDQCNQEITSPSKRPSKQFGSIESGYSSCESSPSGSSPETSQAVYDIKSNNPFISSNVIEVSAPNTRNTWTDKQQFLPDAIFQSPCSGYTKAAHCREAFPTAFQSSTSSPMQMINTPMFLNAVPLPSMTISPIKQNFDTPKKRLTAVDPDGSLKRNRNQKRESTQKVSNVQSRFLEPNTKTSMVVADSVCDDDLLVNAAAGLIVSRIQFKKELQPYIKMDELMIYLKSYYTREIAKLSHRSIKSISDYTKITKEVTFTTERLTPATCYCDLLTAILTNRPRIVSACEEFIFENYDYFIRSRDFFEAAPEIILMLLCNNRSTIFGASALPLRFGDSTLELDAYLDKYIEKYRTGNSRTFLRVKNIFTCIRKKRTNLMKVNPVIQKTYSRMPLNQEFECGVSKIQAHIVDSHSTSFRSIHLKSPNVQREPLQTLCKGTRMFRNKQILYKTQGNIPETTQKLLDFVGGRKSQRSSHQSKILMANIENLPELGHRHSVNVGKYNSLANSALPSEFGQTRSGKKVYAAKSSIYDSRKWTLGRPSVKYVTAV